MAVEQVVGGVGRANSVEASQVERSAPGGGQVGRARAAMLVMGVAVACCLGGCQSASDTDLGKAPTTRSLGAEGSQGEAGQPPAATDAVEPSLEIKSWADVQQWVQGQRGKVVVLDIWSTACHPCMREFPHFLALSRQWPDDVAAASLSVDFYGGSSTPEEFTDSVREFLQAQRAETTNFLCSDTDSEVLKQLEVASIPVVAVYDREGKLHKLFHNGDQEYGQEGFTYEQHINPLVKQLAGR